MTPNQDLHWCNAIQERLERLYNIDGRNNPEHPQHGIYTGLSAKYSGLSRDKA